MSGTSADGIDAVIAEFDGTRFVGLGATMHRDYPESLRSALLGVSVGLEPITLSQYAELDHAVAEEYAQVTLQLLESANIATTEIAAIGSHGQTIFHDGARKLTLQIGDPSFIAARTGCTVIADFRRKDLALGGQGAPLVPAFHHALFADSTRPRAVVNIGGIANITLLPDTAPNKIRGFDTGPGNGLMDEWIAHHSGARYDRNGEFAASGAIVPELLTQLLADPYFTKPAPKSSGRDYFRLNWVRRHAPALANYSAADIQRTLCELTASSIVTSILAAMSAPADVLVCGGGARNVFLMHRVADLLGRECTTKPTDDYGLNAEWVEAAAFAWLAMRTLNSLPGNISTVTGAQRSAVLGGIYPR